MWENWFSKTDEPRYSVQRRSDTFLSFHFRDRGIELNVKVEAIYEPIFVLLLLAKFRILVVPCKRIRVPKSGKFLLVTNSESRNFLLGIRNTVEGNGIPLTIEIRIPSSTDTESGMPREYLESTRPDCLGFPFKRGAIFETLCSCLQKDSLGLSSVLSRIA